VYLLTSYGVGRNGVEFLGILAPWGTPLHPLANDSGQWYSETYTSKPKRKKKTVLCGTATHWTEFPLKYWEL